MESRLLINEPPLIVLPSLVRVLGLERAIILQQIHYWLQASNHTHEGHAWIYNTYSQWGEQFPWMGVRMLRRYFNDLERQGLLVSGIFNTNRFDRTKWYRIDYEKLSTMSRDAQTDRVIDDPLDVDTDDHIKEDADDRMIPKTTQETSTKDYAKTISAEHSLINLLRSLPYWGASDDDPQWLEEFQAENPELTYQVVKECRDYWDGRRAGNKGIWKNRLRNWCKKAREFNGRRTAESSERERIRNSIPGKRKPGTIPTAAELEEQERRLKAGLKPVEGGRFG